jgi:hypothetical protein
MTEKRSHPSWYTPPTWWELLIAAAYFAVMGFMVAEMTR